MKQTQRTEKKAEFLPSLLVMVAAILVLVGGILVLKLDPHIPLIMCTFVLVFYGLYLGISWSDMMSSAVKSISECIEAIIIMMSIGMVVGAFAFRMVYTIALRLDMPAFMLKLVSSVIVVLAIATPYFKKQLPMLRRRMAARKEARLHAED